MASTIHQTLPISTTAFSVTLVSCRSPSVRPLCSGAMKLKANVNSSFFNPDRLGIRPLEIAEAVG